MLLCCRCLLWCRCGLFMLRFLQWNVWFGNAFSTLVRLSVISCWFLEPCALCQQICRNVKTEELLRGGLSTEPRSLPIQRLIHNYPVEKNVVVSGRPNQMRPTSVVVVYVRSPGFKTVHWEDAGDMKTLQTCNTRTSDYEHTEASQCGWSVFHNTLTLRSVFIQDESCRIL
jgi:hypothetical protein